MSEAVSIFHPPMDAFNPGAKISAAQLCQTLSEIPFLRDLGESDCHAIAPLLSVETFSSGDILFYEDDESDSVYFLASGVIEVFKSNVEGRKLPLLVLRQHGLLGEIGLLLGEPRTATARALSAATVLKLSREDFDGAVANGNRAAFDLTLSFAKVLASRLRATDAKLFELFESDVSEALLKQLSDTRAKLLSRMAE